MSALWPWLQIILQQRRRLLVGALLMLATVIAGIALLSLSGWFITATGMTALLWAAGSRVAFDVYVPGGGIRFFALTRTVSRYLERLYNHNTVLTLLASLRLALFARLSTASPLLRQQQRGADWLSRLTADVDALDNLYLRLLAPLAVALVASVVITALLAWVDPRLALAIALILGLTLLLITVGLARLTATRAAARVTELAALRSQAVENLEGMAELQAAGLADARMAELLAASEQLTEQHYQLESRIAQAQGVMVLGTQLAVVVCFIAGLYLLQQQQISAPWLVMMPLALLGLSEAFTGLPQAFGYWGHTVAAAARLNRITLAEQGSESDRSHGSEMPLCRPQPLRWQALDLGYQHDKAAALVSGELAAGERLAITAPSGWGKSTLADRLAGLQPAGQGKLFWAESPREAFSAAQWRARISYLPQRSHIFNDTVRANLLLANPGLDDEQLHWVLQGCCLDQRVAAMPDGLDTLLGASGQQLSGGEQRRLLLARTLLKPSALVILDEPFSGLDQHTQAQISANLPALLQGRSLLVLGHGPDALPPVDRLIAID